MHSGDTSLDSNSLTEGSKQTASAWGLHENNDMSTEDIITIVGIVVGIVLTIIVLFAMAIFMDCRHQKIAARQPTNRRSKTKNRIYSMFRSKHPGDTINIVDNMTPEDVSNAISPSTSGCSSSTTVVNIETP